MATRHHRSFGFSRMAPDQDHGNDAGLTTKRRRGWQVVGRTATPAKVWDGSPIGARLFQPQMVAKGGETLQSGNNVRSELVAP
jgi:hypothetical protein